MIRCSRSNWTPVAVDEVLAIFFVKTGRAAQLLENTECGIDSLLTSFALQLAQMFLGHLSTSSAHSGAQISWLNLTREYRHEKRDQSSICLRAELFRFRAESIRGVRFANARLHP